MQNIIFQCVCSFLYCYWNSIIHHDRAKHFSTLLSCCSKYGKNTWKLYLCYFVRRWLDHLKLFGLVQVLLIVHTREKWKLFDRKCDGKWILIKGLFFHIVPMSVCHIFNHKKKLLSKLDISIFFSMKTASIVPSMYWFSMLYLKV